MRDHGYRHAFRDELANTLPPRGLRRERRDPRHRDGQIPEPVGNPAKGLVPDDASEGFAGATVRVPNPPAHPWHINARTAEGSGQRERHGTSGDVGDLAEDVRKRPVIGRLGIGNAEHPPGKLARDFRGRLTPDDGFYLGQVARDERFVDQRGNAPSQRSPSCLAGRSPSPVTDIGPTLTFVRVGSPERTRDRGAMSKRSATPVTPPNTAIGVLAIDVAESGDGPVPEWIKVAPRGEVACRDGRSYTFDPEALVRRFSTDGIEIPIDLDHAIAKKASAGERADAHGWIRELSARSDGLYARAEFLTSGKAVLKARTHRFVSPAFHHDTRQSATWLHSVALVAAPAIAMPAIASAGYGGALGEPATLAAALGLADGADEAECLSALQAGFVPVALHDQALERVAALSTELHGERAVRRSEKVRDLVEGALKAMKIVPAEADHYTALCATDTGLQTVERLIATMAVKLAPSVLDRGSAPRPGPSGGGVAELTAEVRALMKKRADDGLPEIGYADAMSQVLYADRQG